MTLSMHSDKHVPFLYTSALVKEEGLYLSLFAHSRICEYVNAKERKKKESSGCKGRLQISSCPLCIDFMSDKNNWLVVYEVTTF